MRILFATDLQPGSVNAYRYCLMISSQTRSQVFVMHVFNQSRYRDLNESQRDLFYKKEREAFLERTRQFSRVYPNAIKPDHMMRVEVTAEVGSGSAVEQISMAANEHEVDLVAIASKRQPPLLTRLFGGISKHLIYDLGYPLLIVPEAFTGNLPRHIGALCRQNGEAEAIRTWISQQSFLSDAQVTEYHATALSAGGSAPGKVTNKRVGMDDSSPQEVIKTLTAGKSDLAIVKAGNQLDSRHERTNRHELIHNLYDHFGCPMITLP